MKVVIQRVSEASVRINGKVHASIGKGYLLLLGIHEEDTEKDADWLINKIYGLRIFSDNEGKMNLSIQEVNGDILVISQFTLYASYKKGNRPSFLEAAKPDKAIPIYEYFLRQMEEKIGKQVFSGIFGADMQIGLINDGPVTIVMDTRAL